MHRLRLSLCLRFLASSRAIGASTCLVTAIACDPGSDADDDDGSEADGNGESDAGDDDDSADDDSADDADETGGGDDDDGADTTADDGADTTGNEGGAPIGDDVFFFVRSVGDSDEVWAYDVATDTSHLAYAFDSYADITSVSIHPDRSVLAIASNYDSIDYQASESIHGFVVDENVELGAPQLLMQPWPKPIGVGTGYAQQIDDLRWHPDGSRLWFGHAFQFGISEPGGGALASVDVATGESQLHDEFIGSCTVNSGPSPSPDGSVLLAVRGVCTDDADAGLVAFDVPLTAQPQVLLQSGELGFSTPRWLPGGSGIVYTSSIDWDSDGDGVFDIFGNALLLIDLTDGAQYALVSPAEQLNIWDFTVDPAGTRAVLCVSHEGVRDLLLADFSGDAPSLRWLTDDGVSCKPSW